jgi:magnesium transporter
MANLLLVGDARADERGASELDTPIVRGVDESADSQAAIGVAASLAERLGARLKRLEQPGRRRSLPGVDRPAIDHLEDAIFLSASDEQLQEIFQMKRPLVEMRKILTPQRDAFGGLMGAAAELPGLAERDEHYFRDVYDHLIRISDLIDSYRDLLTGAMDVYLSTVSNRLNAVMKQLTIIATVFLPLTFITGFFGQNFDWLVTHIHNGPMFLLLGVGTEIVALLALLAFFRRRRWF